MGVATARSELSGDESMKFYQIPPGVGVDCFVAAITTRVVKDLIPASESLLREVVGGRTSNAFCPRLLISSAIAVIISAEFRLI